LFRPEKVELPRQAKLDLQLAVLGPPGWRELAVLVVLMTTVIGWAAAVPLGIDVGIVAVVGLLAAAATGNLEQKNLKDLDWNYLLFYGAALTVGTVAVGLGLDRTAEDVLKPLLSFTEGSPILFMAVIAVF